MIRNILPDKDEIYVWNTLKHIKFPGNQCRVRVMVFNATFNNISAISWRSVLLVEETGVPGENN